MNITRRMAIVGVVALPVVGAGAAGLNKIDLDHINTDTVIVFDNTDVTPSPYVQNAQNSFRDSPAGGQFIGAVLVRAPLPGEHGAAANSLAGRSAAAANMATGSLPRQRASLSPWPNLKGP